MQQICTCKRGIWLAAASTVSAANPAALDASLASSRASLSAAAARLDLHPRGTKILSGVKALASQRRA